VPLVILVLTDQLGPFQEGGVFGDGRIAAALLLAFTAVCPAGATAARGMIPVSPLYWDQNDRARSFANRFIAAMGRMPQAAHAAATVAVRLSLRRVVAIGDADATPINREMGRTPVYLSVGLPDWVPPIWVAMEGGRATAAATGQTPAGDAR
jgi:hypothetical protein